MNRVGVAPCQCCSPGSKNTRSPGADQLDRGVKWTLLALRREGPAGVATVSTYTAPVNHSPGPAAVSMPFLVNSSQWAATTEPG